MTTSTTGNREANDLRTIIGISEEKGGLDSATVKSDINSQRGIGYFDSSGSAVGKAGVPDETLADDKVDGIESDGQVTGNTTPRFDVNDPSNGIYDSTNGIFDAEDVIDGDDGPQLTDSLRSDAAITLEGGALKELRVTDCGSGKEMRIRTDDQFIPPNGLTDLQGNLLSNDWDAPDEPPVLAGFVLGKYWLGSGQGGGTLQAVTAGSAADAQVQVLNGTPVGGDEAGGYSTVSMDLIAAGVYDHNMRATNLSEPNDERFFSITVTEADCAGAPPDEGATCPATAPLEENWPAADYFYEQMSAIGFIVSAFDVNVPDTHKADRGLLDFCFGTNRFGRLQPVINGGFAVFETSTAGGGATGLIRYFNGEGKITGYSDSAHLVSQLPQ